MKEDNTNSPSNEERIAFKRALRLRQYYQHLLCYLVINTGCVAINLLTTPHLLWFPGLTLFWGLGLVVHTMTVFVFDKYFNGQWELNQVEKLLGRRL